jgi:hypothetical protein
MQKSTATTSMCNWVNERYNTVSTVMDYKHCAMLALAGCSHNRHPSRWIVQTALSNAMVQTHWLCKQTSFGVDENSTKLKQWHWGLTINRVIDLGSMHESHSPVTTRPASVQHKHCSSSVQMICFTSSIRCSWRCIAKPYNCAHIAQPTQYCCTMLLLHTMHA